MKTLATILAIGLVCSMTAFAQRPGGGRPAGAGSPGGPPTGMPAGGGAMGHGNATGHDMGPNAGGMSRGDIGKQTPDQVLSHNTHLSSNLEKDLPKGMTAQQACSGFGNLGQCVAAVHVSHNLDIPFDQLKARMTSGDSLGKAIHSLKPDADAKSEAKRAEKQAKDDLKESGS